ncbi:hypothetical protein BIW11_06444 [Tropilaelaps mercedesae]|uniref:Uncharacterized protein n=1 Tax=Tropilaelaps mercedesae TaxID=418985 RepID=A0A1V9XY01_9ACAR|nr:hypothetical protein BIW11_06444 [Tropilaelaps mercedesae]
MAHKADFTMLELSVLGPSTTLDTPKSNTSASNKTVAEGLQDFSKLRGKQKVMAMGHLQEIVESLPKIADEQARAQKILQDGLESVQRILDILGDDAEKLPMDALGDFHVLATNPEPFAAALEKAAKNFEQRSPERANNMLPTYHSKKLKTRVSAIELSSCKFQRVSQSNNITIEGLDDVGKISTDGGFYDKSKQNIEHQTGNDSTGEAKFTICGIQEKGEVMQLRQRSGCCF